MDARAEIAEQPLDRRVHVLVGGVGLDLDPPSASQIRPASSSSISPWRASIRTCTALARRSYGSSRRSTASDAVKSRMAGVQAALEAACPQRIGHTPTVSAALEAAAHVLVGSDQTWMNPAAAPRWKASPSS